MKYLDLLKSGKHRTAVLLLFRVLFSANKIKKIRISIYSPLLLVLVLFPNYSITVTKTVLLKRRSQLQTGNRLIPTVTLDSDVVEKLNDLLGERYTHHLF